MPGTAVMGGDGQSLWLTTDGETPFFSPKPAPSRGEDLVPLARQPLAQECGDPEMTWILWPAR